MTLSEFSYYFRRYLPWALLFFILLMIIFYSFRLIFILLEHKPTTIYQNPIFGKIKKPYIKEASTSADFNFILDTIEGVPITATSTAKVYFIPPTIARLGYREKIFLMAKNFGFDTTSAQYKLNEIEAEFTDEKQKLAVNITNFNFRYDYNFENEPSLFEEIIIPSQNTIENTAINFLKKINRYPDELSQGKLTVNFLKYYPEEKIFSTVKENSEANVVEVNFYRPDIDGLPVVTANFPSSQNFIIFIFHQTGYKILRAQIKFFEKSPEQYGIYLLKKGDQAWQELKSGKGFIISSAGKEKNVVIKNMFLAYYDPDIYQEYLQPVYVFVGEPNFIAYVPAISNEYLAE
jgi:hypothetical protein